MPPPIINADHIIGSSLYGLDHQENPVYMTTTLPYKNVTVFYFYPALYGQDDTLQVSGTNGEAIFLEGDDIDDFKTAYFTWLG